jgi:hypothetical protein
VGCQQFFSIFAKILKKMDSFGLLFSIKCASWAENRGKNGQKITEIHKNSQKFTKMRKNERVLSRYGLWYLRV